MADFVCTAQINEVGDQPLRRVTGELGGWPIVLDQWDSDSFVLETVLAKISHDYDAKILIHCYVGADDKNSSSNIIQVRVSCWRGERTFVAVSCVCAACSLMYDSSVLSLRRMQAVLLATY